MIRLFSFGLYFKFQIVNFTNCYEFHALKYFFSHKLNIFYGQGDYNCYTELSNMIKFGHKTFIRINYMYIILIDILLKKQQVYL